MADGELIGGGSVAVGGALRLDSVDIGVDASLPSEMSSFEPHAAVATTEQHSTARAIWRLTAIRIDLRSYVERYPTTGWLKTTSGAEGERHHHIGLTPGLHPGRIRATTATPFHHQSGPYVTRDNPARRSG